MTRNAVSAVAILWLCAVGMVTSQDDGAGAPEGTQSKPPARSAPERLVEMQHHFAQVSLIHEALIRGDLAAVRAPGKQLAEFAAPAGMSETAAPYLEAIRQGGRRAAEARTLGSAAEATVRMLQQCGDCHRAAGVYVAPSTPRKPEVGGIVGHMQEHQRAANEMLQGLVVPSPSLWHQGAERLRTAELKPSKLPRDPKLTGDLRKADARVHQIAIQAETAEDGNTRAAIYGQLLATCAQCHSLHSRLWGPGK